MNLRTFDDLPAVRGGGSSSRLAAHRLAKGLDGHGFPLDGSMRKGPEASLPVATMTPSVRAVIAPKAAPKASAPTAAQIAQTRRRVRHNAVMNSSHAKDRQCTAAGLLGGAPNLSAEQIIAMLPTMPTDAQAVEIARRARAAAAWDNAIAAITGNPRPAETESESGKAWDRAIARNWPSKTN